MNLTFNFDNDTFDYEVSHSEIKDYFESIELDELVSYAEEAFDSMTDEDKQSTLESFADYVEDGKINWPVVINDDINYLIELLDLNEHKDGMQEYFRDDAQEAYEDTKSYKDDSYRYNGVKMSDFY